MQQQGFCFHAQTGCESFAFARACQYFSEAFGRTFVIKMSQQCWAYTQALQSERSIFPLFPGAEGPVRSNNANEKRVKYGTNSVLDSQHAFKSDQENSRVRIQNLLVNDVINKCEKNLLITCTQILDMQRMFHMSLIVRKPV